MTGSREAGTSTNVWQTATSTDRHVHEDTRVAAGARAQTTGGRVAARTQPGRVIGARYRLESILGSGGFGRVWKARDEALDVWVAVKEVWLPSATSDEEHAQRLRRAEREARNAARLRSHPHIVTVHDVVIEDQAPWIVMELVEGVPLSEKLSQDGPLAVPAVAEVAKGVLDGLITAHEAGIVHRDVKPANVMITSDGRALLTDFGIAVYQGDTALTTTGGLVGSLEYMAPERFDGADSAGAGDVYSLGVTLYQALEGVSPFRRDTSTRTLAAVLLGEVPAPREAGGLGPLITRLLTRDPDERPTAVPARAAVVALELPQALDDIAASAGPSSVPEQQPSSDAETDEAPASPTAPEASEAPTERVPPPSPTLVAQAPAPAPQSGPDAQQHPEPQSRPDLSPRPGSDARRTRVLVLAGAAVAAVAAVVVITALAMSDEDPADRSAGASDTSARPSASNAGQSGKSGAKVPPGCHNQTVVQSKWNQLPLSGTVPLPPTENTLTEIRNLQESNLRKAERKSLKTALQNDIDIAEKALRALRTDDAEAYRQAVSKDKLKHLTEISDACFFNDLGPSQSN